jgi:signal transduction histidine kinase/CheY-like chemotaxis protein
VTSPLHILLLEDDASDAELIQGLLEAEQIVCAVTRVQTRDEFAAALKDAGIDLILADYKLPSFDGFSALRLTLRERPDLPFIFVSGTIGEELAIEALKIGATDYVLKQRLSRLVPSVQRALREARERVEHKNADDALRRSEMYLAEAQRLSHTGSFGWNAVSGEIFWSEETFRIFEYCKTTTPSVETALQRVHPEDIDLVQQVIDRATRDQQDFDFEHRLLMPNGLVKHLRVVAHRAMDENGQPRFMGAVMDVTAAKESAKALRDSEQRYRQLFHYMPIALLQVNTRELKDLLTGLRGKGIVDLAGYVSQHTHFLRHAMNALTVEEVNDRAVSLFGAHNARELTGPVARFWQSRPDTFRRTLDAQFRGELGFQEETKITTLDGRVIDVLFRAASPEAFSRLDMCLYGFADISERIVAQEKLQQVQAEFAHAARLSVLGELTASIGHEVMQPLAAMRINGETSLRWLDRSEPNVPKARKLMQHVIDDAGRAADIIARIRTMAAGRAPRQTPVGLQDVIEESMLFLRQELESKGVTVSLDLAPALPQVTGDRTQLQQVVVNLAINATQAMAQSGSTHRSLRVQTMLSDLETVSCVVEDSGPGIDPKHLSHLFDHFFTTKDSGMGMGLTISRSIIEAHSGKIYADNKSSLGGARFRFELPTSAAPGG